MTFNDVFIQGNGYISYCFHEYNMTRTCEKCNQKRDIDCFFVKVDVNLHIARQTQLFLKVNSLGSLSKPRRRRQQERHKTKGLMSKTIAVHVHYNSLYISLPCSAKRQLEMTKFWVVYGTWTTTANFSYFHLELNAVVAYLASARF